MACAERGRRRRTCLPAQLAASSLPPTPVPFSPSPLSPLLALARTSDASPAINDRLESPPRRPARTAAAAIDSGSISTTVTCSTSGPNRSARYCDRSPLLPPMSMRWNIAFDPPRPAFTPLPRMFPSFPVLSAALARASHFGWDRRRRSTVSAMKISCGRFERCQNEPSWPSDSTPAARRCWGC